jgi:hypothetical protein
VIVFLACLYLFAEGLTLLGLLAVEGIEVFSAPDPGNAEDAVTTTDTGFVAKKAQVMHPYLGWVLNPFSPQRWEYPVNAFGFHDDNPTIQHRANDKLIIGIFGGSVAKHFAFDGGVQALESRLRESGVVGGRELVFVTMGLAGHKQPQQLMTLNYILASGGEFDILICLDGFNEITLQFEGKGQYRVAPPFPRNWHHRVANLPNPKLQMIVGERAYLRENRRRWNEFLYGTPWRYSPIITLVRRVLDQNYARRLAALQIAFENDVEDELSYEAAGPRQHWPAGYEAYEALIQDLVDIWARSTRQMHYIAEGNGALFIAFLQPNQYLEGSKRLTAEELDRAYSRTSPLRSTVNRGYPRLRKAGAKLAREGVRFRDLSGIYSDVTGPIHTDYCCHVNRRGNELIAEAMAREIIPAMRSRDPRQFSYPKTVSTPEGLL